MSSLFLALPLFAVSPFSDGERGVEPQKEGERRIELTSTRIEKDAYLLGCGFGEKSQGMRVDRKAYAADIDGRRLLFFDLDRDRKLTRKDGFGFEDQTFVVPLPEELLLSEGQFSYRFDGLRQVILLRSALGLDRELFPAAIAVTEVRVRAGLKPLVVEREASLAARAHLDYLEANRVVRNGKITMEAHREHPGRAGYSIDGARAGGIGILGAGRSLTEDVMGWYASAFHGVKLLDPRLERIGMARRSGLSLIYPVSVNESQPLGEGGLQLHPPDGARGIPPNFSRGGEVPSPIEGGSLGAGSGFPVFVRLSPAAYSQSVKSFEVRDAAGELVRGHVSTPTKPASSIFPRNMGCAFFIPATRLENGTLYTVTFLLEGMRAPIMWSFRTWEWEPKDR